MAKKQKSRKSARRSKEPEKSRISPLVIGIVVAASLLVVGGLILLGNQTSSSSGGTGAAGLDLTGFPTLGNENATVTMVEFSDYG